MLRSICLGLLGGWFRWVAWGANSGYPACNESWCSWDFMDSPPLGGNKSGCLMVKYGNIWQRSLGNTWEDSKLEIWMRASELNMDPIDPVLTCHNPHEPMVRRTTIKFGRSRSTWPLIPTTRSFGWGHCDISSLFWHRTLLGTSNTGDFWRMFPLKISILLISQ